MQSCTTFEGAPYSYSKPTIALQLALLREALASLPQMRLRLTAVESENAALQRQVATLEARCAAQQQSITSLEAAAFQAVKLSTDHSTVQAAYTSSSEALTAAVKGAQAREAELAAARDTAAAEAAAAQATIEALKTAKATVEAEREELAKRTVDLEGALLAKSQAHREELAAMTAQLEAQRRPRTGAAAKPGALAASFAGETARAASATGKAPRGGGGAQRRAKAAVVTTGSDDDADFEPDIVVGRATKPALATGPPQASIWSTSKQSVAGLRAKDMAGWADGLLDSGGAGGDAPASTEGTVKRVRFSK